MFVDWLEFRFRITFVPNKNGGFKVKMDIKQIIAKKRDNKKLTKEEISYFIKNYTNGKIADYQAAALIMAIYINGMDEEETTNLSLEMTASGEILDLSEIGTVVDKHSTGGIGDKVTLILAPILASLEIPVAKMSGRGLGYTGGTIDKLESIPGYQTNIELKEFMNNVKKINIALIGQTLNLAPADKKLYALRDTIACTDNIPLIASSIMSKKIAAGASKIVLDVTAGNGAFMKEFDEAKKLAITMKKIGELANKETVCIITNMDEPLGKTVGNSLEVIEAVNALKGDIENDVKEVVFELGAYMIKLAGKGDNIEENKKIISEQIENGKAFEKFKQWIQNQGGDIKYIEDTENFEKAKYIIPVISNNSGYVKELYAQNIGEASMNLGAGRIKKEDIIDFSVGITLEKKIGDIVKKGEILAYIHSNDEEKGNEIVNDVLDAYVITDEFVEKKKNILYVV